MACYAVGVLLIVGEEVGLENHVEALIELEVAMGWAVNDNASIARMLVDGW